MYKMLIIGAVVLGAAFFSYKAFSQNPVREKLQDTGNKKILVAYFSYSGNTKSVAQNIHDKIGGDIFEIKAEDAYPSEYRPMTEQVKKEIQEGYRPKLTTSVDDIRQYDIIFLGSPTWWGTIPPQVSSFLESYDLSGKVIVPFITHGGGGAARTVDDIAAQCKDCRVSRNGWTGYKSRTLGITGWLKDLGFNL